MKKPARRKLLLFITIDMVILIALLPTIISKTGLRDQLINRSLEEKSMRASTRSASLGYFTPLFIEGFDLRADDGSLHVEMESMTCEKSWLAMLFSGGDLGKIQFLQPSLSVVTDTESEDDDDEAEDESTERSPISGLPTFVAEVDQARVMVRDINREDATLDLQDLNFTIRTEQSEFGSVLSVDATDLLNEEPLTPELCNQGMQLIAPMFADSLSVQGSVSFRLDHCSIPVGDLDQQQKLQLTEIDGTIRLTDVSVGLNNQIATQIASLLARFVRVENDLRLTVSRSSQVRFYVVDGRVHHQGLAFLLPIAESDFEFVSSGSVGFDETLDLRLTLALPGGLLGDGPVMKFLSSDPLAIQIVGTIKDPQLRLAGDQGWQTRLQSVLDAIGPTGEEQQAPSMTESAGAVLDLVGGLLDRGEDPDADEEAAPGLLERLRERREQRSNEPRRNGLLRRRREP